MNLQEIIGRYSFDSYITCGFESLQGRTIHTVCRDGEDGIYFVCKDGTAYLMQHISDCCEYVRIEDVCGDLDQLVGSRILVAECREGEVRVTEDGGDQKYTFYTIRTMEESVDIRWNGESNGYYSVSVNFTQGELK